MSSNPHNLKVGQTLHWVPSDKRWSSPKDVEVTKVGRRWANLSNNHRIDLESLCADGGDYSSPACCWLSREAHATEAARRKEWESLAWSLRYARLPESVTVADIEAARKLLGIVQ